MTDTIDNKIKPIVNPRTFKPDSGDYKFSKTKYVCTGLKENWNNYIEVYRNPYMKSFLHQRQNGLCPVCGKVIDHETVEMENTIHHITYDSQCTCKNDDRVYVVYFTPTNPKGVKVKAPNCHFCRYANAKEFEQCTSNLMLVHRACHSLIHKK